MTVQPQTIKKVKCSLLLPPLLSLCVTKGYLDNFAFLLHWELLPIIQGTPTPPPACSSVTRHRDTEIQNEIIVSILTWPGLAWSQDSGQLGMKSSTSISSRSPILILRSGSISLSLSLSLCNYNFLWGSSSNKYFSTSLGWLLMSPTYWGSPNDQPSNHQSQFYSICSLKKLILFDLLIAYLLE